MNAEQILNESNDPLNITEQTDLNLIRILKDE